MNKREAEDLVKKVEGYANHRDVTFSEDEQNKMEELAQRIEVKAIIEAKYAGRRAEETERAYRHNMSPCFFYANPVLQDCMNKLGHSLVPRTSTRLYAFRALQDPFPEAWTLSTGSIYITTASEDMT